MTGIITPPPHILLLVWYLRGYKRHLKHGDSYVQEASTSSEQSHWPIQQQGAAELIISDHILLVLKELQKPACFWAQSVRALTFKIQNGLKLDYLVNHLLPCGPCHALKSGKARLCPPSPHGYWLPSSEYILQSSSPSGINQNQTQVWGGICSLFRELFECWLSIIITDCHLMQYIIFNLACTFTTGAYIWQKREEYTFLINKEMKSTYGS